MNAGLFDPGGTVLHNAVGADGTVPSALDLAGSRAAMTGLFALEDVDLFNFLMFPNQSGASLLAG